MNVAVLLAVKVNRPDKSANPHESTNGSSGGADNIPKEKTNFIMNTLIWLGAAEFAKRYRPSTPHLSHWGVFVLEFIQAYIVRKETDVFYLEIGDVTQDYQGSEINLRNENVGIQFVKRESLPASNFLNTIDLPLPLALTTNPYVLCANKSESISKELLKDENVFGHFSKFETSRQELLKHWSTYILSQDYLIEGDVPSHPFDFARGANTQYQLLLWRFNNVIKQHQAYSVQQISMVNQHWQHKIEEVNSIVNAKQKNCDNALSTNKKLTLDLEKLQGVEKQNSLLQGQVSSLQEDLKKCEAVADQSKQLHIEKSRREHAERKLKDLEKRVDILSGELATVKNENKILKVDKNRSIEEAKKDYDRKIAQLHNDLRDSESKCKTTESDFKTIKTDFDDKKEKVALLNQQVRKSKKTIKGLEKEIKALQKERRDWIQDADAQRALQKG